MQDLSFADRVFPPNRPTASELPPCPEGVRRFAVEDYGTFLDIRYTVEDLSAEGDRVVVRWSASGTEREAVGPIPPTGGFVSWSRIDIFRIRGNVRGLLGGGRLPRSPATARR